MKDNSKVLLTTFVYGVKYQAYIPLLVYSCNKSYPEYDIILFVYGNLDTQIRDQVNSLQLTNVTIVENSFADCPKMTPRVSQCLRWVLWDDKFRNYDYVYVVDIDMLYIKEPEALHIQHIKHMQTKNLLFDNIRRVHKRNIASLATILQRFKYAKFRSFFKFLFSSKVEYRATGLHFIDSKNYYHILTPEKLDTYKYQIYSGKWTTLAMYPNDEVLLYAILEKEGLNPEKMTIQTDSTRSLDFHNPERAEYRPHHGIHLGIFRKDIQNLTQSEKNILDSDVYRYYFAKFTELYDTDKVFVRLVSIAPDFIKNCFKEMLTYYGISDTSQLFNCVLKQKDQE